jgi:hypothetical protein
MALTVREQLTGQAELVRETWGRGVPDHGRIMLGGWCHAGSVADLQFMAGRVNAAEICGIPAGHLLIEDFPEVPDRIHGTGHWVIPRLLYGKAPWYPDPVINQVTDFDALLAAIEPPPDVPSVFYGIEGGPVEVARLRELIAELTTACRRAVENLSVLARSRPADRIELAEGVAEMLRHAIVRTEADEDVERWLCR